MLNEQYLIPDAEFGKRSVVVVVSLAYLSIPLGMLILLPLPDQSPCVFLRSVVDILITSFSVKPKSEKRIPRNAQCLKAPRQARAVNKSVKEAANDTDIGSDVIARFRR